MKEQKSSARGSFLNARMLENIFVIILALYPLRHIHWGLDLWDTGYNYANFEYMGTEHMDSMWLFSTYLANVVGNFLTKLPKAGTLAGMNFYTGLFVSALALTGYFFCTRELKLPKGITFAGELAAVSLCWCPTALLYNYLTYVLYLVSVILLYRGLTRERKWCLFGAGICLGANVLVRFSNLPEAAMIVAVWAYVLIQALEATKTDKLQSKAAWETDGKKTGGEGAWIRAVRYTLWCLGGYLAALLLLLSYIHLRYGLGNYVQGIGRLFAMTDVASDYKAESMIMGMVNTYVENLYWVVRIGVLLLLGMVCAGILELVAACMAEKQIGETQQRSLPRILKGLEWIGCIALAAAMVIWLYLRGFCSLEFYTYGPILRPGILFLMLTMIIAVIRIFHKDAPREEKLISGMVLLIVVLTSLGSNNKLFPSMNNLFLAAPYTFWQVWRFVKGAKTRRWKRVYLSPVPAKCLLSGFLLLFLVQVLLFGREFVFAEATGVQNVTASVENNPVLKGIKMNPERAEWMTEITAYVQEKNLTGREVLLYGGIPSLSYYLQMPSAFNPWSDLPSYQTSQLKKDLAGTAEAMERNTQRRPVVIVERKYAEYLEGGTEALQEMAVSEKSIASIEQDEKWKVIVGFLEEYGYQKTFSNEKFVIYE